MNPQMGREEMETLLFVFPCTGCAEFLEKSKRSIERDESDADMM